MDMLIWFMYGSFFVMTAAQDTCQPLKIEMCSKELNYTYARFPNEIGHTDQDSAANDLLGHQSLIDTINCSNDLKLFICSLYAPYCNPAGPADQKIVPCRELCLNVRERCNPVMIEKSQEWPNSWRCGRFPVYNPESASSCVLGKEKPITEKESRRDFTTHATGVSVRPTTSRQETKTDDVILVEPNVCRNDQMYCDATCIPVMYRCDQFSDCLDGKDEQDCDKCLSNQFRCLDGKMCIPFSSKCDTVPDCEDASDEEPEQKCGVCSGNELQCDDNRCIPNSLVCDNRDDCLDGADEAQCGQCQSYEFRCANNRCVPQNSKCDGSDDCGDGSDEASNLCYNVNPDPDDTDNNNEVTNTCRTAHMKCNEDSECKKETLNYRLQCEIQMASVTMTTCTKACYNAYYQLRSKQPYGRYLINEKCNEVAVRNVELSCIRQPVSMACLTAIDNCRISALCENMYTTYSRDCDDVLTQHDTCSATCSNSYKILVESPLSKELQNECQEVNETMRIRCPQYALGSSSSFLLAPSLIPSIITVVLLMR